MIEATGKVQCIGQRSRLLDFLFCRPVVGHFETNPLGQFLYRLGKTQAFKLPDKADGIAMGAAPEAMVKALVWPNVERGCFLVVERAAGLVVSAGLLERDA